MSQSTLTLFLLSLPTVISIVQLSPIHSRQCSHLTQSFSPASASILFFPSPGSGLQPDQVVCCSPNPRPLHMWLPTTCIAFALFPLYFHLANFYSLLKNKLNNSFLFISLINLNPITSGSFSIISIFLKHRDMYYSSL